MTDCQQTPSSACALWLRSVFQWQWAAYAGGGAPSAGHRDELLCLYGPEADWWRAAGSANGRSSNEVQEDWSRQTDVGGIIQTSERNLLGEVPLPSWSQSVLFVPVPTLTSSCHCHSYGCSAPRASSSWGGTVEQVTFLLSFKLTHVK